MERSLRRASAFLDVCREVDAGSALDQALRSTVYLIARDDRTFEDSWKTKPGCTSRLPDMLRSGYGKEE